MPISDKYECIFIHIPKNAGTSVQVTLKMMDISHHDYKHYQKKYPLKWDSYKKFAIIRNTWDRVVSNYEYARAESSFWHDIPPTHKTLPTPKKDNLFNRNFKNLNPFTNFREKIVKQEIIPKHKPTINNPFITNNKFVPPINVVRRKPIHPDYNLLKDKTFEECVDILVNNKNYLKHPGWGLQKTWIYDQDKLMVDELIKFTEINERIFDLFGIKLGVVNQSRSNDYKLYYNEETKEKVYNFYKVDIDTFGFEFE